MRPRRAPTTKKFIYLCAKKSCYHKSADITNIAVAVEVLGDLKHLQITNKAVNMASSEQRCTVCTEIKRKRFGKYNLLKLSMSQIGGSQQLQRWMRKYYTEVNVT